MFSAAAVPVALTLAFGGGFVLNEWSHGSMSEAVGLGHHHMLDFGGYHCADHNDTAHAAHHASHMHANQSAKPHGNCPGGQGMHHGGMGGAGGMHGG